MDSIRYLLGKVIKLALGLFLLALVLWLVGMFIPSLSLETITRKTFSGDWLPAPKNYVRTTATGTTTYGTVYQHGEAFNGYGDEVIRENRTLESTTEAQLRGQGRSAYLRNLSVYEGGTISYGTTFVGEARDTMFKNGLFTILVVDKDNRILGTSQAINTGTWATSGWSRFQATVSHRLPAGACTLIFMSGTTQQQIRLPVTCR